MALDPNIILGGKPVQLDNPIDLYTRALNMKQLAQKSQVQDQEIQANAAVKNAYNQNTSIGPDGAPVLDQAGTMASLANNGYGKQALDLKQQYAANNLAIQEQKMKTVNDQVQLGKTLFNQVRVGPNVPQETTQSDWSNMLAQREKLGLANDHFTPQFPGQEGYDALQKQGQTMEEKLAQKNKEIDQTTERAKANASLAESGLPTLPAIGEPSNQGGGKAPTGNPAGTGGFAPPPKMRQKAMEDYNSAVSGSRQQADATQALKDIQAGQKLSEITKLAPGGDLNKLNNQQTKLAITELVKMAGGTAPTESELHEMTPDNLAQKYSGILQGMTNKSQPANAGEFIQQGIDYANGIQKLGAQKLSDRANEFADRQRPYFGEQQYKMVKEQIANEHKSNSPAGSPAGATVNIKAPASKGGQVHAVPADQVDAALRDGGTKI